MEIATSGELLEEWREPGICVLRMNRPKAYNALTRELVEGMRATVARIGETGARVMVLAASKPGFCSGADLKQRKSMTDEEKYAHNRDINALANDIAALPIPTIAVINGIAVGGGCELPLACDLRYASSDATIGLTEARIGAMPGAGGSQRLPRLIGIARSLEMMLSGEPISAAKAEDWGLVNAVVDAAALDEHVMSIAKLLASRSRRASILLKKAVYGGLDRSLPEGLELERLGVVEILSSAEYKEGLAAFMERRPPKFD